MKKWFVGAALLLLTVAGHASSSLESLVAAQYPPGLTEFCADLGLGEKRQQAYVTVHTAGGDYVVAAYSNGRTGAIRLLKRGAAALAVEQTIEAQIGDNNPIIVARDLDADGHAEVMVTYDAARGSSASWIYRIADGQLVVISPVDAKGSSRMSWPDILDFSGTGVMDLVDKEVEGRGDDTVVTWHHLILKDGKYVDTAPLAFYGEFRRATGEPKTETVSFPAPEALNAGRLTVVNGGEWGAQSAVSSGTITLNGVVVSSPSDFGQKRLSWTVPVALKGENVLAVRLDGKPRQRVAVAITPHSVTE